MSIDLERVLAETPPSRPMHVDPAQIIHKAKRRRLRRRASVGTAGLVAAGLVVGAVIANPLGSSPRTLPASQLPPATASVTDVTKWYLQKVEDQNCAAVRSMTLPGAGVWCSELRLKDYKNLQGPDHYDASWLGKPVDCMTFERLTPGSADHSIPSGWSPWELCFNKTSSGWRLFGQGML